MTIEIQASGNPGAFFVELDFVFVLLRKSSIIFHIFAYQTYKL